MQTMTLTFSYRAETINTRRQKGEKHMAIYKLSTGNLLITLTAWSPHGLAEGQVQIEADSPEYQLLEPSAVKMSETDEAAFKLLRSLRQPFIFRPWKRKRSRSHQIARRRAS